MLSGLVALVDAIIVNYLLKSHCITLVTENLQNDDLITGKQVPFVNIQADDSNLLLKALNLGCPSFIVHTKDPISFLDSFGDNIHLTNQRNGRRKLIFLPFDNTSSLSSILDHPLLEYVPDVLIVLPKEDVFELATHKFVEEHNHSELIVVDKWFLSNESFLIGDGLFVDKIANMKGRKLRAATFNYKPYAIFELDENNTIIGLDGTEMSTAVEFCNWVNCTIQIIRDDEHEWGEIWDNKSGNGILGNVAMDKADIGYGALYTWYHEYKFLDLSMPIVRTGITCVAPSPELMPGWLLPILPFNAVMWIGVFLASIYVSVAVYFTSKTMKRPLTKTESFLTTIGILVLQVPSFKNPPSSLRHVVNWMMLFTLMVSNIYSSGLASSITVPTYHPPIDTVQELVDSKLDWGATHDAWIFSILEATQPNLVYLVNKFKKYTEEMLESRSTKKNFAYSVERLPAGYFAIGEYVTEKAVSKLRLMSEDIYWEQCVMMARKSSPYTDKFNTFLGRVHQSGLIYSWETKAVLKHANYAVQLGVRLSTNAKGGIGEEGPKALTFEHLQGPLFIWAFGMSAAAVVFVIEIVVGRRKHNVEKPDFPKTIHISFLEYLD